MPALRRPSPLLVDVTITLVVYAATVYPSLRQTSIEWWNVPFATLASVPLLWRRRAPIVVAVITGIGTVALSIEHALPQLPYGQLVATYTFAELSNALWRVIAILITIVGIVISLRVPAETLDTFGYTGIGFVTAYALGTGVRARRDRIAMLEERTKRLAEEHLAATARERSRIARDMHDVLAHSVGLMVVQAEGGASIVHTDPVRAEAAFEAIAETGREALVQLRHTLGILREQHADDSGQRTDNSGQRTDNSGQRTDNSGQRTDNSELHDSGQRTDGGATTDTTGLDGIERLVRRARSAGLNAGLTQFGTRVEPPHDVSVAAYRVVQEALTNTVKHAGATQVGVMLQWGFDGQLRVTVSDDGRGATATSGGHGLVGMRERVNACGGELYTGPRADGTGFRVHAILPVVR